MKPIKTDFIPTNEKYGLVILWGRLYPSFGLKMLECGSAFPDCVMETPDKQIIRVELEYKASNFLLHGHPVSDCDLVVCWEKDADLPVPTISIASFFSLYSSEEQEQQVLVNKPDWLEFNRRIKEVAVVRPRYWILGLPLSLKERINSLFETNPSISRRYDHKLLDYIIDSIGRLLDSKEHFIDFRWIKDDKIDDTDIWLTKLPYSLKEAIKYLFEKGPQIKLYYSGNEDKFAHNAVCRLLRYGNDQY